MTSIQDPAAQMLLQGTGDLQARLAIDATDFASLIRCSSTFVVSSWICASCTSSCRTKTCTSASSFVSRVCFSTLSRTRSLMRCAFAEFSVSSTAIRSFRIPMNDFWLSISRSRAAISAFLICCVW